MFCDYLVQSGFWVSITNACTVTKSAAAISNLCPVAIIFIYHRPENIPNKISTMFSFRFVELELNTVIDSTKKILLLLQLFRKFQIKLVKNVRTNKFSVKLIETSSTELNWTEEICQSHKSNRECVVVRIKPQEKMSPIQNKVCIK